MALISVVVPCYNEADSLPVFVDACKGVFGDMRNRFGVSFELVLVDDGSNDATLERFVDAERELDRDVVKWLSFSRNFGKESALLAGLEHARGDYVAVMDADMQDPPALLPEMYERILETGCDNVATRRATRSGEPPIRSFFARCFYKIINAMSETEFVSGERDFRLMTREMTNAVISLGECNRFSKGIFSWVGFKTEWISYDNVERAAGKTKWSFFGLARYALDGITAFSTAPLQIASVSSFVLFLISVLSIIVIVVRRIAFGDPVAGWASTACIILFVGAIQLFCLGVIGQYLAKTYLEAKSRPSYIVKETNFE